MPSEPNANPAPSPNPGKKPASGQPFQPPRGTRDFYPIEMARRLWLEAKWRSAAVRHGFDEIDGPTFEHLDLYTVKSGEGIVNELFSFTRAGGETAFALRPEFTPTLARMVATKANALAKPIKWFSIGPYFRAERPQRGRLREFLQWNVDLLGDPTPEADAEVIACCAESLRALGLKPGDVEIRLNDRRAFEAWVVYLTKTAESLPDAYWLADHRGKMSGDEFLAEGARRGLPPGLVGVLLTKGGARLPVDAAELESLIDTPLGTSEGVHHFIEIANRLELCGAREWCVIDTSIVRGLAYYTGTVFEVHETTGAERAIAGGGRYDNLVELFGGPPTPAVGFAMGDVVLSLVLQDKGLMPSDNDIARDLGIQPDAFVFAANDEADAQALRPLLAHLRRNGLHARRSYKSTRNVGKLLQDADKCGARFAVILESPTSAKVKDLGAATRTDGEPISGADLADLARKIDAHMRPQNAP